MDVTTLAPTILSYLIRYLPQMTEAGKFIGGKALEKMIENATDETWKIAAPWIEKLMRKIEDNPAAFYATRQLANSPENAKYQTAVEVALENILLQDRALAAEIWRMVAQSKRPAGILADHGSVALGDHARDNITLTGEVRGDIIIGDKRRA